VCLNIYPFSGHADFETVYILRVWLVFLTLQISKINGRWSQQKVQWPPIDVSWTNLSRRWMERLHSLLDNFQPWFFFTKKYILG
jgi:hypothetical protein